ncbi:hypothetical protein SAMN04488523_105239 [Sulfitobacter brevis]|uniref:Peptidase propeptide and YPEB domain-containing protein n=1 Tax=Sulfitobacter brevis TaxID=74348 RepID=A0A1I1YFH6_9RHOB|nr:hypothetical protein [Sulfitobacter brevis]SFE18139.1 hypothetical protein SAMN04488523_105239 [Sulfitobacter brevis]
MKLNITAAALLVTLAGTASFAQGIEGQQIGYNDKSDTNVSYSTNGDNDAVVIEQRLVDGDYSLRVEDRVEGTVTIYKTFPENLNDGRISR